MHLHSVTNGINTHYWINYIHDMHLTMLLNILFILASLCLSLGYVAYASRLAPREALPPVPQAITADNEAQFFEVRDQYSCRSLWKLSCRRVDAYRPLQ